MKRLVSIIVAVLFLATLVGCSNPPKSAVGDMGIIVGIQLGDKVCISATPRTDIARDFLFFYKGIIDGSYSLSFWGSDGTYYSPIGTIFNVTVDKSNWFSTNGTATLQISNFIVLPDGTASLTWTRIK